MWIEDITHCSDCDREVVLTTDGREAYVYVAGSATGDTAEVWRDGFLLKATCPVVLGSDDRCGNELSWTGEGGSADWNPAPYAEPILEVAP